MIVAVQIYKYYGLLLILLLVSEMKQLIFEHGYDHFRWVPKSKLLILLNPDTEHINLSFEQDYSVQLERKSYVLMLNFKIIPRVTCLIKLIHQKRFSILSKHDIAIYLEINSYSITARNFLSLFRHSVIFL